MVMLILQDSGSRYHDEDGREIPRPTPRVSPPAESSPPKVPPMVAADSTSSGMGVAQYRRMDTMFDMHSRFANDLSEALGSAFRASGVEVDWPVFGAGAVYPPLDTPPVEGDHVDD